MVPTSFTGIIPAGAGLTKRRRSTTQTSRDHPRGCGAHGRSLTMYRNHWGSSPRVRGSLKIPKSAPRNLGIIPAGAGLTRPTPSRRPSPRDHPRGCGAHARLRAAICCFVGSSPRVRGSQCADRDKFERVGIIPAGAGLTRYAPCETPETRDHPRGCGAHSLFLSILYCKQGSSPRVRGSLYDIISSGRRHGIIPAGAGLTLKNPNNYAIPYSSKSQDHSLLSILTRYPVSFILLSKCAVKPRPLGLGI